MWFSSIVIVVCLILSAFFSGMEIAYISANKIHIELEKKQSTFIAEILKRLTKKPSQFIAAMLVGNNIALVVYGFFIGDMLIDYLQAWFPFIGSGVSLLLQTLISTIIILLTAEFLPKVFFQIYANRLMTIMSLPAYLFYLLLSPISWGIMKVSNLILKLFFRTEDDHEVLTFSKTELGDYINQQVAGEHDDEWDSEIQIFQNALEFSDVRAREIMVPRIEVIAIDRRQDIEEASVLIQETGLSKIIVFNANIDDVVGYVHAFDFFKRPKTLHAILRPVVFVPETMFIKDVLNVLTKRKRSIAIVVDEYGGTSGLITVEDIIEELFGEIEDEHDTIQLVEEKIRENCYRFSSRIEVDYLNEHYELGIPVSESYETIGGYIMNYTEEIPGEGEILQVDHFRIKIVETQKNRIVLIEFTF